MDKLMWSQDGGAGTRDGSNVPRGFSYTATCAYQAPVSEPDQLDQITSIASRLNAQVVAQEDGDTSALSQGQPDRGYLYLDQALPDELQELIDTARANGIAEVPAIRRDADTSLNADGLSPRQAAQIAAMRYLVDYFANGDFTYSVDAPDGSGSNNLQVIANLLQERRGHCVHYASALAVLGRALGVPTRLVLGYRANADGAAIALENGVEVVTYQATNHDLHAWTEAFIDNVGWVSFDVTPSIAQSDAALDAGITWSPCDTEEDIARSIASALDDTAATTALFQISRGMCAMRYGGESLTAQLTNDLSALLGSALAAIDAYARRTDGARNAMARANRRLVPASLFAQRHIRQR